MPRHGQRTAEETSEAGREAFRGAIVGAAKVHSPVDASFPSHIVISHSNCGLFSGVSLPVVSVLLATSSPPSTED